MKTILLMSGSYKRSQLMETYYKELGKHFNIVRNHATMIPVEQVCKENDIMPDYIYWGFGMGDGMDKSADWINENNIPVIIDSGDPDFFTTENRYSFLFWRIKTIKYVIARWPKTEGYELEERTVKFMRTGFEAVDITYEQYGHLPETFLSRAELIHVPWAIDPEDYPEPDYDNKDIDVTFMCSMGGAGMMRHMNRYRVYDDLLKLRNVNLRIGNFWDEQYINTLERTKIFIVEGSGIKFLTQKYLEAAMRGCLLMGDIPFCGGDTFNYGTMVDAGDWSGLSELVTVFLRKWDMVCTPAVDCRERVIENFHVTDAVKDIVERLK